MGGEQRPRLSAMNQFKSRRPQRCVHPGQQQGRRFPSRRLEQPQLTRLRLVSNFLADWIQQIHSLRAKGVISFQVASAWGSSFSAPLNSSGRSWTTPPGMFFSSVISGGKPGRNGKVDSDRIRHGQTADQSSQLDFRA